ncbi:tetratricopeptide repeat protein [Streptomyces xanthii]|uniref:Tetratricopeptide repeat protein n=1 Tax=Streptomyces xanthii TaxID=2768069 RepID=A0A7H1BGE5_9ACTN|nr:tetratricopeptide repeat protein [Streptomyces xanthii]QNS07800.1 tetratricopeptide repeat protein [Streptomyces xanthii]
MLGTERDLVEARRRVEDTRRRTAGAPGRHVLPALGEALGHLSALLVERPEHHDELTEVEAELVDVCRQLAGVDAAQWRAALATALYRQALTLGVLGWRSRALEPARESVELTRLLVRDEGEGRLPALAASLTCLGNQLAELGRHEEALALMREAVGVRGGVAGARRGPSSPQDEAELASAESDLGIKLGEMGRRQEAATVLGRALERYEALRPAGAAALPHWVTVFALVRELTALGRAEEARPLMGWAAAQYRELARTQPDMMALFVETLRRYGWSMTEDGRLAPAEAVQGPVDPAVRDRVRRRSEQGLALASAGEYGPAHGAAQDAVDLCRQALEAGAGRHMSIELARCLHNLALVAAWSGRRAEALTAVDEAVRLYRGAVAHDPDVVRPLLASSLDSLGTRLATLGRHPAALAAAEESAALHRRLDQAEPGMHQSELARVLNNLGIRLTDNDRHEDSLRIAREVVDLYRQSLRTGRQDGPEATLGLVHALANLALRLARTGRDEEILAPTMEAVRLLTEQSGTHPRSDDAALAESLGRLGDRLIRGGHRGPGRSVTRTAQQLRRRPPPADFE